MRQFDADPVQEFSSYIRGIESAMLTMIQRDGLLVSRPVVVREGFDGQLYLLSEKPCTSFDEIDWRSPADIVLMDSKSDRFLSACGSATITTDPFRINSAWRPNLDRWFAGGVRKLNLVMTVVRVHQAQCWDTPFGELMQSFVFPAGSMRATYSTDGI